jgi:hypothetical protein
MVATDRAIYHAGSTASKSAIASPDVCQTRAWRIDPDGAHA